MKREVDTNRELYTSLLQRYKEVDVASGVGANNVFVVDKAGLPGSPSSPNLSRALMLALVLGLGAGLAAAYLLERLDDKVRSAEQVESISGLSILGVIPKVDNRHKTNSPILDPPWPKPTARFARPCCSRRRTVCPRHCRSRAPGQRRASRSRRFAIAKHFATLGRKVLLIDADLRNPSLHMKLGRDNSVGLSNYLTGACTPPEAMQKTEMPNLAFMASGPLPPNAADLLGGVALHSLYCRSARRFSISSSSMGLPSWASLMRNYCRALRQRRSSLSVQVKHDRDTSAAP